MLLISHRRKIFRIVDSVSRRQNKNLGNCLFFTKPPFIHISRIPKCYQICTFLEFKKSSSKNTFLEFNFFQKNENKKNNRVSIFMYQGISLIVPLVQFLAKKKRVLLGKFFIKDFLTKTIFRHSAPDLEGGTLKGGWYL
jgi:hypothetical protein